MKKWFYVDITTTCHERVAVKAENERSAADHVCALVDAGTINFAEADNFAYGSINDSIVVDDYEYDRPPKAMRKFDGPHEDDKVPRQKPNKPGKSNKPGRSPKPPKNKCAGGRA